MLNPSPNAGAGVEGFWNLEVEWKCKPHKLP